MLKDEASLSREKMNKIDLLEVINNVVEDFKTRFRKSNKKINIVITKNKINGSGYNILGIESRLEQVIAVNLLDNAISFSSHNQKIEIVLEETTPNYLVIIKDEGPGFAENSPQKSSRDFTAIAQNFGEHSGLGLNIVKNIVELHKGTIVFSTESILEELKLKCYFQKFNKFIVT